MGGAGISAACPISRAEITKWRCHLADGTELCHQGQCVGGTRACWSQGAGWLQAPVGTKGRWQGGNRVGSTAFAMVGTPMGTQPPPAHCGHLPSVGCSSGGRRGVRSAPSWVNASLISCTVGHQRSPVGKGTVTMGRGLGTSPHCGSHPPRSPLVLSQISHSVWAALVVSGQSVISCQNKEGDK